MKNYIDTDLASSHLRIKGINIAEQRILITRYSDTEQSSDLTLPPNCNGFGRIHHFKRVMDVKGIANPLPIDPAARFLGLPPQEMMKVQVFQNAICSWRCWYCFVDYKLLSGNQKHSEFKTVDELIDLYLAEPLQPPIIDLSGGQPDLVPEWTLWFADALKRRGLHDKVFLWSDDNLSNDYLWKYLTTDEIKRLASYKNYSRVGCFKGFDANSFSFNTGASPDLFDNQFRLMKRIVQEGFDVYGYATFTSDNERDISTKMREFVDKLQEIIHPNFPLRTVPLTIFKYTPTEHRMDPNIHEKALLVQAKAFEAWEDELGRRFSDAVRSSPIYQHKLV